MSAKRALEDDRPDVHDSGDSPDPVDPQDDPPTSKSTKRAGRESKKCNECRRRHVKCDELRPRCTNCEKADSPCSYSHKGVRYDHISDRQKRDDVYTEIEDISVRVESLLMQLQKEPVDDVARLAKDFGWDVSIAENGQKRIVTNILNTSQLAALVPKALSDVYGASSSSSFSFSSSSNASIASSTTSSHPQMMHNNPNQPSLPRSGTTTTSSVASSPASHPYSPLFSPTPVPSTRVPTAKPRKTKRVTLERYVAAYTNPSIHVLSNAIATCPSLFTVIMSPRLLERFAGHPQLSMLHTSACATLSLNRCKHNPQGLFSSTQSISSMVFDSPIVNADLSSSLSSNNIAFSNKDLADYLGTHSDDTAFPTQPRFAEVSLANLYWNLLKTAKLLDDGNFNQAFVNLGVMITKAFSLQLHQPEGYAQFETPLEREAAKRIFWSIWLFDTQMPLLVDGRPSIKLDDITIDKPSWPHTADASNASFQSAASMNLPFDPAAAIATSMQQPPPPAPIALAGTANSTHGAADWLDGCEEDMAHTECLRYLVETRWLRVQIENTLNAFTAWDDEKAILSLLIQQMRKLRRFYELLDDSLKLEAFIKAPPMHGWHVRARSILLLEHAMNWLVLFDRFLPLRNEESKPITPFPANLAIHFCRQAADAMTLVFEKWLAVDNDCQFRWFFSHFVNCLEIHKYIATFAHESTVHKWKAYASLNFMMYCLRDTPVVELPMGRRIHNDLCQLVVTLRDIVGSCWNPSEEHDLIESFTKYFSEWRPSFDPVDTKDNGSLFAKESSTMFIILQMQRKAKALTSPSPMAANALNPMTNSPSRGVTVT
ncbi:hypothetical protein BC940DRAFT_316395 [Gongronella butleri]|nr:hypothetical protein BC940DRAFT_316395 [Gongronella butleri]